MMVGLAFFWLSLVCFAAIGQFYEKGDLITFWGTLITSFAYLGFLVFRPGETIIKGKWKPTAFKEFPPEEMKAPEPIRYERLE
jgi:hypothetical protein